MRRLYNLHLSPRWLFFQFLLFAWSGLAFGQSETITGRVTDENGTGLPGVSVVVKGTTNGTATDVDGRYSLPRPASGSTLTFSYIGYLPEEVSIGNQTVINIGLVPDVKALSEVVVIGYGEKDRRLLTESIGTVTAKELTKLPVPSPDAAIQGRVSGVQVTNVDGRPGSPVSIRIRGVGTVENTQPLFVIDGVPVGNGGTEGGTNPLATINPNDIESLSVLKDASAAAVYGVRAANGVVLITTKRGKTGKPRVSFDSYVGIQRFPTNRLPTWNNTEQFIQLANEMVDNRNAQDNGGGTLNEAFTNPNSPLRSINTDWQGAVIKKEAPIHNYNVSVSGGTEMTNYNISAGYFRQEALIPKWDLSRYNFRANSDYKIGKRLKIGETFSLAYQEMYRGSDAGGNGFLIQNTSNLPPFFRIYDTNNEVASNRYGYYGNYLSNGAAVAGITEANSLAINALTNNYDRNYRLLGGLYAELEIITGLKFRSAASLDFAFGRNTGYALDYTLQEAGLSRPSEASEARFEGFTQVFTNTLSYQKALGNHNFNVLTGIEYQKFRSSSIYAEGKSFLVTDPSYIFYPSNGAPDTKNFTNNGSENALVGYLGRLSYDFKQKYLLTFSIRRDGTAQFAPGRRYGTFPAVSAAWRMSEEPFIKNIPFITELKLRGSWGQMGNSSISQQYAYVQQIFTIPDYGSGNVSLPAPSPVNFPNSLLSWERVETTDFGFDISVWDNRLSLLATYYNRNTRDFLYNLPLPYLSGYGGTYVNLGLVNNQGVELELTYNGQVNKDLTFSVSGNLTTVKNRLMALAEGISEYASDQYYRTAIGYPLGYFYGFKTAGIYQTAAQANEALEDKVVGIKPQPGDVIFVDTNGPSDVPGQQFSGQPDGKITPEDRTYLGKTIPDFYYGLNLSANYKNFDLSILFQGVGGVQLFNRYRWENENLSNFANNQFSTVQNRWRGENTSNSLPRAVAGDPYGNNRFSDRYVENAGFLRFKNIQLGYSLPKGVLDKTKAISSARIYVAATNLFVITDYTGLDPEVQSFGSSASQLASRDSFRSNVFGLGAGTDVGTIPQPRTFQLGLQVTF